MTLLYDSKKKKKYRGRKKKQHDFVYNKNNIFKKKKRKLQITSKINRIKILTARCRKKKSLRRRKVYNIITIYFLW